jgi:DNA polymerase-3 subunit beta
VAKSPIEAGKNGSGTANGSRAIVPTKGMQLFCRVIDDPSEVIALHFGENQIGLKTAKAEIFARLIDGEFPRYAAVVPTSTENSMKTETDMLSRKLRLVANVTSPDTRAVRLSMEKDELTIFGKSAATGEATAHMNIGFEGKPGDIAFNPDYLLDGLKNCETDVVQLDFNDRTSPGKFTLGENYTYVVMPITIDA